MDYARRVQTSRIILTEGALIERLRRDPAVQLDPHILHAGLIYDPLGREQLAGLYRRYLSVGRAHDLPMIVCTPSWRANPERLRAAGLADTAAVNADGCRFLAEIRAECGDYAERVHIGGLMGCCGDAYEPAEALESDAAAEFHAPQAQALAAGGVDFLMAATLPAASEALGIARAMAACGVPYVLSFVVRAAGTLLDGTPLHEAVAQIDAAAKPPPLMYAVNCVHPAVFEAALRQAARAAPRVTERVLGLQANTSARSPEELDGREELDTGPPEAFAEQMLAVHRALGTRVLGGCCGTDDRHIRALAEVARRVGRS